MAIYSPKASSSYQSDILDALKQTGIKQTASGGKARAFCDVVGDQMGILDSGNYQNLAQTMLPYANEEALDNLGEFFGIPRMGQQDVSVPAGDNNFVFYVRVGTFGSINGGAPITIPAGTRIYPAGAFTPYFTVDYDTVLPADSSSQAFSATCEQGGSQGNVAAGTLTQHNFSSYTDARYGSLLVTNTYGTIGGRESEDDDSYRYRIKLELQSVTGCGEDDLRAAILQIPGIQDVTFERLAGTFQVYVYAISPDIPASLLQLVQMQLDRSTAYPLTGTALAPDLIGISLHTTLHLASGILPADQTLILTAAQQAAADYINNLGIGAELVINEISDRILNSDTRIVDLGQPNQPLEEIFIWRSRVDGSRYSRFLINNYTPVLGERLVVENMAGAITLTVE
jgi:uncharacterized phage protein gp47/JayE